MRINIYAEEMTDLIEFVSDVSKTGETFYGFRFYLSGHGDFPGPHGPDVGFSAVTFWFVSPAERVGWLRSLGQRADPA